ncbi:MAG: septum formation initiator family protein [Bacteroidota bacterium]
MNDQYLRKKFSRWILIRIFIRIWKNSKLRVFLAITSVALYAYVWSDTSVLRRWDMENENVTLKSTYENEQQLQQTLRDTIERLKNNDPLLIEKNARELFNMSKKREVIYVIVKK